MLVECNGWVFAFASLQLVRVVLDSEVRVVAAPGANPTRRLPPLALIAGQQWSAWDLGLLFGLPRVKQAWSLFEVAHGTGRLKMALRTGRCLAVAALPNRSPLPPGMFRRRREAVSSAFIMDESMRAASGLMPVGLAIDVQRLWTASELALAEETLASSLEVQRVR